MVLPFSSSTGQKKRGLFHLLPTREERGECNKGHSQEVRNVNRSSSLPPGRKKRDTSVGKHLLKKKHIKAIPRCISRGKGKEKNLTSKRSLIRGEKEGPALSRKKGGIRPSLLCVGKKMKREKG